MKKHINVKGTQINVQLIDKENYISLTDIARHKNPDEPKDVVKNWLRSKNTIEFLGLWENINNSCFKGVEFDTVRMQVDLSLFIISTSKWVETNIAKIIISC